LDILSCKPLVELASRGFRNVPEKAGVYMILWVKNRKPVTIQRIRGSDERGILYIGSAVNLRRRMRELWRSIQIVRRLKTYPEEHTFGATLLYTGLHDVIADQELYICFKVLNKQEAKKMEKEELLKYTRRYGEPPPLNLNIGRRYFMNLGALEHYTDKNNDDPINFWLSRSCEEI